MRARRILAGLASLFILMGILIGLPAVLLALGGNPLPDAIPSLDQIRDALLTPDDGTLALAAVKLLGWVVWAALTVSILTETVAALRGVRAPSLPALSLPQAGMRPLVLAALTLFVTVPATLAGPATAVAAGTPGPAVTLAVQDEAPAPPQATPRDDEVSANHQRPQAEPGRATSNRTYVVQPGDTLWSIAAQHLGSGHAYQRIVELNPDQLSKGADWVTPGMRLRLPPSPTDAPASAQKFKHVVVREGDTLSALAAEHLGEAARWPEIYEASTAIEQPDGRRLNDPDLIYPGWQLHVPVATTAAQDTVARKPAATPAESTVPADRAAPQDTHPDADEPGPKELAAAQTSAEAGGSVGGATPVDTGTPHPATAQPGNQGGDAAGDGDDPAGAANEDQDTGEEASPAWVVEGLVGSGLLLGGAVYLALAVRRRSQFRFRRPGRALAPPDPVLGPVEKTVQTHGRAAAFTVEQLDEALRRLGAARLAAGEPVPNLSAARIAEDGLWLHLREPADLGLPWQPGADTAAWLLPGGTPLDQIGPQPEAPAPFPLLVSIGSGDDGSAWLLNLEDLGVCLTGQREYVDDLARYLAAEVAVNPWSAGVRLDCVGVAGEVAPMNPTRIRVADNTAVEDLVAEVVGTIDRVGPARVPTARVRQDSEDTWPGRVVLLTTDSGQSEVVDQLLELLAHHPGQTGACVVLHAGTPNSTTVQIEATGAGRIRIPDLGLDLVGVGLTADEAAGCAALLAQAHEDNQDVPMPPATTEGEEDDSWRAWTDQAGAIRPEHTLPREADHPVEAPTVLPLDEATYEQVAPTTARDVQALAPKVHPDVAEQVLQTDPTLDEDLAAWWNPEARVPRLTLLGSVKAKTFGKPLAERKAYLTELLAYLALHPQGVTTAQIVEAFGITEGKTRDYIGRCREWLGQDATGQLHIPYAPDTPASRERGVNVYQVQGLLVDVDLFRRLRARGEARGEAGIEDFKQALRLVQGRPFDQLRRGGWGWLLDTGDRLDLHMACAIVDVAHTVVLHDLAADNVEGAKAAAEIALLANPGDEMPTLDLVAATLRAGHVNEARQLVRDQVCNRVDDPDLPPGDLPERTQEILDRLGWLDQGRRAG